MDNHYCACCNTLITDNDGEHVFQEAAYGKRHLLYVCDTCYNNRFKKIRCLVCGRPIGDLKRVQVSYNIEGVTQTVAVLLCPQCLLKFRTNHNIEDDYNES